MHGIFFCIQTRGKSALSNIVYDFLNKLFLSKSQTALDLQGEEDPVASLDLEGARGPLSEMSSMDRERDEEHLFQEEEDLEEAHEEPDTALPPLVNIQNRMSQPMGMSQAQGITVSPHKHENFKELV